MASLPIPALRPWRLDSLVAKTTKPAAKLLVFLFLLAVAFPGGVPAGEPSVPSLCTPDEQVVFSCGINRAKVVSLCASSPLTRSEGYLQYRFGTAVRLELVYPETKAHPKKRFLSGTQMYSGGGSAFLKFRNGDHTYVVFTGAGKGWEKEGVVVEESGRRIACLQCKGGWNSSIGPDLFEDAAIPRDPNETAFEIP